MKQCKICLEFKPLKYFYTNQRSKDGHVSKCRLCRPRFPDRIKPAGNGFIYDRKVRKSIIDSYKTVCIVCGEDDIACLQFHHLRDKKFNISTYGPPGTKRSLLDEIAKCVVVCANCHMKYHNHKRFCFLTDRPE